MAGQRVACLERGAAVVAREVPLVAVLVQDMSHQSLLLVERGAARLAHEIPLRKVKSDVHLQVVVLTAEVVAVRTLVGLLSSVVTHVSQQSVLPMIKKKNNEIITVYKMLNR